MLQKIKEISPWDMTGDFVVTPFLLQTQTLQWQRSKEFHRMIGPVLSRKLNRAKCGLHYAKRRFFLPRNFENTTVVARRASISRGFWQFFGCWTSSKKMCHRTQQLTRFLSTGIVTASSYALWRLYWNKVFSVSVSMIQAKQAQQLAGWSQFVLRQTSYRGAGNNLANRQWKKQNMNVWKSRHTGADAEASFHKRKIRNRIHQRAARHVNENCSWTPPLWRSTKMWWRSGLQF